MNVHSPSGNKYTSRRTFIDLLGATIVYATVAGLAQALPIVTNVAQVNLAILAFIAYSIGVCFVHFVIIGTIIGLPLVILLDVRHRVLLVALVLLAYTLFLIAAFLGVEIYDAGGKLTPGMWFSNGATAVIGAAVAFALATWAVRNERRLKIVSLGSLVATAALLLGVAVNHDPRLASGEPRPNVVMLVADTLRADHMGLYGYERPTTPFIDRWAQDNATVFERAYVQYSASTSSHSTILTGCHGPRHGATSNGKALAPGVETIATRLEAEGYATGGFHDHPLLTVDNGFGRGFDVMIETHNPTLKGSRPIVWRRELHLTRLYDVVFRKERHSVTDLAEDWLRDVPTPFFLWVVLSQPHTAYHAPRRFTDKFVDPSYSGPMDGTKKAVKTAGGMQALDAKDVEIMRSMYDAEVAWVDESVSRLVGMLETRGVLDDTIVTLTSDHGEALGEHGMMAIHGTVFEESIRVPLIVAGPGMPAVTVSESVGTVDLIATLLRLTRSTDEDKFCDGNDLSRTLNGAPQKPVLAWKGRKAVAVNEQYKLILSSYPAGKESLYDLHADPGELRPIDEAPPGVYEDLRAALDDFCTRSDENRSFCTKGKAVETEGVSEAKLQKLRALGYID